MSHVESDSGLGVSNNSVPEFGILIVNVFNDEDSVGRGSLHKEQYLVVGLVAYCCLDNFKGMASEVILYAEELPFQRGVESLFLVGIVVEWLEEDVAYELISPR